MKKGKFLGIVMTVVYISMLIIAICLCSSCTTTKVVTVEKVRTDTLVQNRVQRDSIWLHDSIRIVQTGDTIRIDRWHTKYVEKLRHDSIYIAKVDSIPMPYEVIKEVPKKLSMTQRWLMLMGMAFIVIIVLFGAMKIRKFLP